MTRSIVNSVKSGERRDMLMRSATGFGLMALSALMSDKAYAGTGNALSAPHFKPRAKRVIFVFLQGAISQMDTIEYKPQLQKDGGKPGPGGGPRIRP